MRAANIASFVFAASLLISCAEQEPAHATATPVRPQIIGNVKSLSSADLRTILDLERDAILKEFHSPPTSITIRVINPNHVMFFFDVRGQQCGNPLDRVNGKWSRPAGPRVIVVGSNQAMQPTAGRSEVASEIMKTHPFQSTLALTSGG